MESRSVSRCIAVAAHGKRCQQSPFRGSPYCWHHNQSRKVWPPSRPAPGPATMRPRALEDPPAGEALRASALALTARMVADMDEATLAVLVDFIDSGERGALVLAREGGRVMVAETGSGVGRRPGPRRAVS
ncbi:MAG: hypothetical protein RIB67_08025 [Miltoncostaeaceae bacterium]